MTACSVSMGRAALLAPLGKLDLPVLVGMTPLEMGFDFNRKEAPPPPIEYLLDRKLSERVGDFNERGS
jgi:hypothetical protein